MFSSSGYFQVTRFRFAVHRLSLVAIHKCSFHMRCQVRIFAKGFIGSPPARIPVHVDGWRPVSQVTIIITRFSKIILTLIKERLIQEAACLIRYRFCFLIDKFRVPAHSSSKIYREAGGTGSAVCTPFMVLRLAIMQVTKHGVYPMLALTPIKILVHSQPGNCRCKIGMKLFYFFL